MLRWTDVAAPSEKRMGEAAAENDPRFTGHFEGLFAASQASSRTACASTRSFARAIFRSYMPGVTRPMRRRPQSSSQASPSRRQRS